MCYYTTLALVLTLLLIAKLIAFAGLKAMSTTMPPECSMSPSSPPSSFPLSKYNSNSKRISSHKQRGSRASSVSASDRYFDPEDLRPVESAIARSNRKQRGPAFNTVTIELPVSESCLLETTILSPATLNEPSNPLVRSGNRLAIFLHPWSKAGGNASDP